MSITQLPPSPPAGGPVMTDPNDKSLLGTGSGQPFNRTWSGWFRRLQQIFNANFTSQQSQINTIINEIAAGQTVTITTAKLTTGGTNGSLTFTSGILTGHVNPT